MKISARLLSGLVAGFTAWAVSSCAYDPYYSGSSYSAGYGNGYGYGGSGFSTSFFVSTGNPRWGYDPYAGCYYDYTRRSYYDPYLSGYYPVGYRPRYVSGAPHPHGWSRGSNYCPPPSRVRSHTLSNYGNRAESYRSLGRDWSRNVSVTAPTNHFQRPSFGGHDSRQHGYDGSHGSTFPQRQERDPSRGGSFQWGGDSRERGHFRGEDSGARGFSRGNTQEPLAQPPARMERGDGHRGGFPGASPQREAPPQIERPTAPPQPQIEQSPALPQRMEQPAPPSGGLDHGGHGRGGERPEIRSLGEG